MTQQPLFPELEPQAPEWPGFPTLVSSGFVRDGGRCGHCDTYLPREKAIHKLAPACCERHLRRQNRSKNGPGVWTCHPCRLTLEPKEKRAE